MVRLFALETAPWCVEVILEVFFFLLDPINRNFFTHLVLQPYKECRSLVHENHLVCLLKLNYHILEFLIHYSFAGVQLTYVFSKCPCVPENKSRLGNIALVVERNLKCTLANAKDNRTFLKLKSIERKKLS